MARRGAFATKKRVAARARKFDLATASLSGRCTETGHVKAIDFGITGINEPEDKLAVG
jgi:hypothetical protein